MERARLSTFLLRRGQAMKLRYCGVLYEYHYDYYSSEAETVSQSMSVLHYQGVFYSREILSSDCAPKIISGNCLQAAISIIKCTASGGRTTNINTFGNFSLGF